MDYVRRAWPAVSLAIVLAGCAALPDGGDVEGDIKKYAYQNKPRLEALSSLVPAGNPYDPGLMALPFTVGSGGAVIASSDFPWRIPAGCRRAYRQWLANHPARVADQAAFLRSGDCNERPKDIFVGAAITGGGNKSAVFATEVLFELQRYGIAKDIDALSSVSGGSLAAVLYALSCDPGHESCADGNRDGWKRPVWTYKEASEHITTGYLWPFAIKRVVSSLLLVNPRTFHGSDDDLASTLGDRLLKQGGSDLTFADLNPARPNLVLNATNMTRNRADFDQRSDISYDAKRPLSDDDALHFSYTQQYFWRLGSDLDRFPLKYAVAASAGFPLLIDAFSLRHYKLDELQALRGTPQKTKPTYVSLMDGGIHDNFGVTELLWFVQCQSGQNARRAQWTADIYRRECGTAGKPAAPPKATLAIGINSSLLRSTGRNETVPKQRSWDTYVSPIRLSGTAASVDMLMAASGEMRKMQLRSVLEVLNDGGKNPRKPDNPFAVSGPNQYVDIDIEALLYTRCKTGPRDSRPINSANGGSETSRCEQFEGVLKWNRERNLRLPAVAPNFCATDTTCPGLAALGGKTEPTFIEDAGRDSLRTLDNQWLFEAVRDVPTSFELDPQYVWSLRYAARWSVAVRLWNLCQQNRKLVEKLSAGAEEVCDRPLPSRKLTPADKEDYDDNVGSAAWRAAFGR
jgi:Patatin-like phospholipase